MKMVTVKTICLIQTHTQNKRKKKMKVHEDYETKKHHFQNSSCITINVQAKNVIFSSKSHNKRIAQNYRQ